MSDLKGSLLVFADDWGRHPSSCQQLVRELLDHHPVTWVNTIGMRSPSLSLATLRRALEELGQWTRPGLPATGEPANPKAVNPRMWPRFRTPLERWVNQRLLLGSLATVVRQMPRPVIGVTTIPVVADLVGKLPVDRWVYYCVDDFSVWPGLDQATIGRMEEELVHKVDRLIAVSQTLCEKMDSYGREAVLLAARAVSTRSASVSSP